MRPNWCFGFSCGYSILESIFDSVSSVFRSIVNSAFDIDNSVFGSVLILEERCHEEDCHKDEHCYEKERWFICLGAGEPQAEFSAFATHA